MFTDKQKELIDSMDYGQQFRLAFKTDDVDVLDYMSNIGYRSIRLLVAKNPCTPLDTLTKFTRDMAEEVAQAAKLQLSNRIRKYIDIDKPTIKGILE